MRMSIRMATGSRIRTPTIMMETIIITIMDTITIMTMTTTTITRTIIIMSTTITTTARAPSHMAVMVTRMFPG